MDARKQMIALSFLIVLASIVSACGGAAAPQSAQVVVKSGPAAGADSSMGYSAAATSAPAAAPTAAPQRASLDKSGAVSQLGANDVNPVPYRSNQMIIKNGEMNLRVADTDQALDRVTSVAVEVGGYVISSKTWLQNDLKYASVTMGVPVDQFEAAQRRLRALAVQVLNDTASGQDVSAEYVDTQSRVANLEATAARIREFLAQAKKVDEALDVNAKLTEVEAQIEQAKGRMQYLKDRAAFSTLAVNLEPQPPTPTVTPSPTPAAWRPDKTFTEASGTLVNLLQGLGTLAIWLGVLVMPFALPVLIGWAIWRRAQRKRAGRPMLAENAPGGR